LERRQPRKQQLGQKLQQIVVKAELVVVVDVLMLRMSWLMGVYVIGLVLPKQVVILAP
jgi:hypothetical protein